MIDWLIQSDTKGSSQNSAELNDTDRREQSNAAIYLVVWFRIITPLALKNYFCSPLKKHIKHHMTKVGIKLATEKRLKLSWRDVSVTQSRSVRSKNRNPI